MRASTSRFYGWTVVAAAFVIAIFGWGVGFYGPPVFLKAVRDARGWSLALVSAAMTVHFLVGAIAVANLPKFYRKFGLPNVTIAGATCLAFGVVGWAVAVEPWQLFIATLFSGAGWVALGAAGINAMVSPWFTRRRPAALSAAYNGASVGGVIFSPLWVALIGWGGFAMAAVSVGIVMAAAVVILATRVLNRTPASMGLAPDGDEAGVQASAAVTATLPEAVARLWPDRAFQTLAAGMALGLFAQIGLIAHLFSLLATAIGPQDAGLAMGLATASAIAGRTLVGWFMPVHADRRLVGALNYGVQIAGCCTLLAANGTNVPLLLLGVVMFGLGIGNATSMPPLIAQAEFAKADTVRVVALITAVSQGSFAFAPMVLGVIRETTVTGESSMVPVLFLIAVGLQGAAALAYWIGRDAWRHRPDSKVAVTLVPSV
jgi:MFS family permease